MIVACLACICCDIYLSNSDFTFFIGFNYDTMFDGRRLDGSNSRRTNDLLDDYYINKDWRLDGLLMASDRPVKDLNPMSLINLLYIYRQNVIVLPIHFVVNSMS